MKQISVILDNIRSLYNVGSFFRTSDGLGISKLYLTGITATPDHPKLAKTSLGAEKSVTWEYHKDVIELINKLKLDGMRIISIETGENAIDLDKFEFQDNDVLVFGHEVDGVNKEVLELSDAIVKIPMQGIKESFNVASSFAIVAYVATKNPSF